MALKVSYTKRIKNVTLKSGNAYIFEYLAWQNDPKPTIIFMYSFSGTHPKTGRQWRFIQGINLSYVPRVYRKDFMKKWFHLMKSTNNPKFTWQTVIKNYPYLKNALRRYFYSPNYYIKNIKAIPLEEKDWEKSVVSTFSKDFSKKVTTSLWGKFKRALGLDKGRKR